MKLSLPFTCLVAIATIALSSCQADNDKTMSQLQGRWEIKEALSNGRPTERLSALFYEFKPDGQMTSNMTGSEQTQAFELDGDRLLQKGGALEADYRIVEISDSLLVLSTVINNYDFHFTLRKVR